MHGQGENTRGEYYTFNHYTRTCRLKGKKGVDTDLLQQAPRLLLGACVDVHELCTRMQRMW